MQHVIARIDNRLGIVLVQHMNLIKTCTSEQFIVIVVNQGAKMQSL